MSTGKRQLKRQLNLAQVVMLGTAGAIGAEIFVLTGHVAGLVGPATVLVLLAGGFLTYSIALNYCEMATAYPVTGGAMTYVREAYGNNILSFLVGSLDCLSSTFYAALSAVGFAYSLSIFFPFLPIAPTALAILGVFTMLNILGVVNVGNVQIALGGVLLLCFAVYVVLGFVRPGGFGGDTFLASGGFFIHEGVWKNFAAILNAIALIYVAYVGFEVIADDAEEIQNPNRNIPLGILLSLGLVMLINVFVTLVTLGVIPWTELRGSEQPLTDAVGRFIPGWGVPMMGVAGLIATLTTINTSMLSATREAFTLSRDGAWPRILSKVSRIRTPYVSIIAVGVVSAFITIAGQAEFLAYISSAGYLFVLFWASLAMIRLRKLYPDLKRPFKVPFFPLTAYLAAATGFLIIAFTEWKALLFCAGVIAACSLFYYGSKPAARMLKMRAKNVEAARDRILVPVANPRTAESLMRLASILAQASEDTLICMLTITPEVPRVAQVAGESRADDLETRKKTLLDRTVRYGQTRNVPLYTKTRAAASISQGILEEAEKRGDVKLIMMGWPGPLDAQTLPRNPANEVLMAARTNFAVLLDRGLKRVRSILVPIGGGPHSRLAIRLAYEIARQENAQVTAVHLFSEAAEDEQLQDEMSQLHEIIEDELGGVPARIATRVAHAPSLAEGILAETNRQPYDLVVVGASEEWASQTRLFGSVDDWIADKVCCSVLLVRRYEPVAISWLRRQVKLLEREHRRNGATTP